MKTFLCLVLLAAALSGPGVAAPIVIPAGGMIYTQNFDSLANATNNGNSVTPWADDSTIPGWWLFRAGNAAVVPVVAPAFVGSAHTYVVCDGTANAAVGNFQSLGAAGSTDRALGNASTKNRGELSAIVIFQNSSARTQELTGIRHNVEVRRTNINAGATETLFVWSRFGSSVADIQTMTTGTANDTVFPGSVALLPDGNYVTGWYRIPEAEITYVGGDVGSAPVNESRPVNTVPSVPIRIAPGQFFSIRYSNINDRGNDHFMGIDDVELTFTPLAINLEVAVSGVVRHDSGTPAVAGDDTVDFTLTVTGTGVLSAAGWVLISPGTLAGETGSYGVARPFTGLAISEFSALQHTLDVIVQDEDTPSGTASVVLTAPWCTLTPVFSDLTRDDRGTAAPLDDTWGFTVTVGGQFGSAGWTSDHASLPSGTYGVPVTVAGLPIAFPRESITFKDAADPACSSSVTVSAQRIIGTVELGVSRKLLTDAGGVPPPWAVDEASRTQSIVNGDVLPAVVYRSEVLDLRAEGGVKFTGSLLVNDTSSGNEPEDIFNAQLIIDGNTAAPVSLISYYDTLTPANGVLTGAEITPAYPGPPPGTGGGDFLHRFFAMIPESANSVQLVITGANDSGNETWTVQELTFQQAAHSLFAYPAGALFDNKGTVSAADDEFHAQVAINAWLQPAESTGWTSGTTPASGLYTDPNPVAFGPWLLTDGAQTVILADNFDPSVTATLNARAPVPDLLAEIIPGTFVIVPNGPGLEDDGAALTVNVLAPVGGPEFRVYADYPVTATADSNVLTAAGRNVAVTLRRIPDHGLAYLYFEDASYPRQTVLLPLNFGDTVTDPSWILAKQNPGSGLTSVFTAPGSALPVDWQNYPEVPALGMNGGVGAFPVPVTSEVIDFSGVSGDVLFTGNLHVVDIANGFEADDTFKVELILNNNTASPVNLISAYDTDGNGVMNGGAGARADEFNAAKLQDGDFISDFPFSYTIPDSAATARLVITGLNNSDSEAWVLENCLFALPGAPASDSDGDGVSDADEAIMGTLPFDATSFTRLAQTEGLPGEFTFTGAEGRFYRIYQSDDADPASHFSKWLDSGMPTLSGAGSHSVNVSTQAGVARRLYRVHVKQTDGPWPATVP